MALPPTAAPLLLLLLRQALRRGLSRRPISTAAFLPHGAVALLPLSPSTAARSSMLDLILAIGLRRLLGRLTPREAAVGGGVMAPQASLHLHIHRFRPPMLLCRLMLNYSWMMSLLSVLRSSMSVLPRFMPNASSSSEDHPLPRFVTNLAEAKIAITEWHNGGRPLVVEVVPTTPYKTAMDIKRAVEKSGAEVLYWGATFLTILECGQGKERKAKEGEESVELHQL
uniref:Uncharacterized protein n=1 Tax=Arundo donax TaxID=35708 RepID=A0A0A8XZU1_ARUDO